MFDRADRFYHRGLRDSDGRAPSRGNPVQMRDLTNFMLSREGDHFLNVIRQVIREEVEATLADHADATDVESAESGASEDDLERLRALVRQTLPRDDSRRRV